MYLSSKIASSRLLAAAVAITLWSVGVPALQAKQSCGPVVRQKPVAPTCGCATPILREKPTVPQAVGCCPIDPKEVRKAEKELEHAQHEAAEACQRQQKEVAKQQAKIDKAQAKAEHEIGEKNEKLAQRNAELAEANEQYAALTATQQPTSEGVAEVRQPEPEIYRSKPMPEPEPVYQAPPAPPQTQTETAIIEETPVASIPRVLPKTSSSIDLIGLVGLLSTMTGYLTRFRK